MVFCPACSMGLLGTRYPVVVEIAGALYAFHPTCLTRGRHRRKDPRPLTEERRELEARSVRPAGGSG
jgi:hypothetical protein